MAWQLVYENDANGSSVYGNIDDLIREVQNGSDIRVLIGDHTSFTADFIQIENGMVRASKAAENPVPVFTQGSQFPRLGTKWFATRS